MKTVFLTLVLAASTFFAKAQTTWLNIQNATSCTVYYTLYAGPCGDQQSIVPSVLEFVAPPHSNFIQPMPIVWAGTPAGGSGIVGMRVYSDPASCTSRTYIDVFAPTMGSPLPGIDGPVTPVCSGCPPFRTFIESYCGSPTNIFRFF